MASPVSKKKNSKNGNPNGANQYLADPRQSLFLSYYLDPKSKTFSNALQSALKAGFAQEYAESIMSLMPTWLSEKLGNASPMLMKAERNLEEVLDMETNLPVMGPFGPIVIKKKMRVNGKVVKKEIPIYGQRTGLLKIKSDVSQFVAERIGKAKYGKDSEGGGNKTLVIVLSNQTAARYGANPSPSQDSLRSA